MSCNCNEPKKYEINLGCCVPVIADARQYYTKYQVDKLIESATTSGCCITPEEVDEKIASAKTEIEQEIPSLSGYATEQWVEDKHYITGVDLSNYALKSEIPVVPTSNTAFTNDAGYLTEHQSLSGYATEAFVSAYTYDKETIDEKVAGGGTFDPTQYYNKTATDALLDEKLDATAYTPTDLSNYYNKTETNNQISSATADMATQTWVTNQHYITGVDLSNYATKAEIPVVPTSNTAFTNDAGYLTEHQSLSAYSTTSEVNTLINQSVSGKQDTLSAGTNISIVDNVISATGGGGNSVVELTQAAYDSLVTGGTVDPDTFYIITDATPADMSQYWTSAQTQSAITQSVSGKVDTNTYTAYTATTQTTISSKADSSTLNNYLLKSKIWCGTQLEYDSIQNKDSETLYLIHE